MTFAMSYLAVDLVSRELNDGRGTYAAYGQNLLMSALFVAMLLARRSTAGQSVWIAAAKLAGTGLAALRTWFYSDYPRGGLLVYLFITIAVLDLAYLVAVFSVLRSPHPAPAPAPTALSVGRLPERQADT